MTAIFLLLKRRLTILLIIRTIYGCLNSEIRMDLKSELRLLYFATPASTTCGLLHANPLFDSPCKGLNPPMDEEPE